MKNAFIINTKYYHVLDKKLKEIGKDSNIDTFSLKDLSLEEIIEDACYNSLFSTSRTIVVKDVSYFSSSSTNDEETDALINLIKNIDEETKIVLVCDEVKKTKKCFNKILPFVEYCDLSLETLEEVMKYIKEYRDEENILIDDSTLKIMIENYQNNVDLIINELNKLSFLHKKIDIDIINEYSFKYEDDKTFEFSNAIVSKNYKTGFELLDKMLNSGVEVSVIVGVLANSFINMYLVKSAKNDALSDEEISKLLEYNNPKRVYAVNKNASLYTIDQIKEIISGLASVDLKIKTGYDPVNTLKSFLITL